MLDRADAPASSGTGDIVGFLRRKVMILGIDEETVELGSLLGLSAVVLLGDPGMGKTASMDALAAAAEGKRQTVRAFLAGQAQPSDGKPRFLDALDEAMAVRKDIPVLDQAVTRLSELGWPPFWLSCRHADWVRTSDGQSLIEEALQSKLTVARLLPLEREDIVATAKSFSVDADNFLTEMEKADLLPILGNPETLRLTLEIFNKHGAPASRTDLYDKATERLADEPNRTHAGPAFAISKIRQVAGAVSAALLLSGEDEVVTRNAFGDRGVPRDDFRALASREEIEGVLASRLFTSPEPERWTYSHRTIAEYLAARFLAARVRAHGLPMARVLALVCEDDGAPKFTLRGLFAWLTALLPERADTFAGLDPYAAVTYGDTSQLPHNVLRAVLNGLRRLVEVDPFFRAGRWADPGFKAFCQPEFTLDLREMLAQRPVRVHLLGCVFEALEQGGGLPTLAEDLGALIADISVPAETRRAALYPFLKSATDEYAAELFGRLLNDAAVDSHRQLSGILLRALYPRVLRTEDLCDFIVRFSEMGDEGSYRLHPHYYLPELIPAGDEGRILDVMIGLPSLHVSHGRPAGPRAEMRLLARSLFARAVAHDDTVSPEKAVGWLPLIDAKSISTREPDELRAALSRRPDCYVPFLLHAAMAKGSTAASRPHMAIWLLQRRWPQMKAPDDIVVRLLTLVEADPTAPDADILYGSAFHHMVALEPKDDAVFERFWEAGEHSERLNGLRGIMTVNSLEPAKHRWEENQRLGRRAQKAAMSEKLNSRNRAAMRADVAHIRSGKAVKALVDLALEWFGKYYHETEDSELSRAERMANLFPPDVLTAAEEGFKAFARSTSPFKSGTIKKLAGSGYPYAVYPMVAGADLLFEDDPERFLEIGLERLIGLLCLGFTLPSSNIRNPNRIEERPWICAIVERFPEQSDAALSELIRADLEGPLHVFAGLDEFLGESALSAVRKRLLPSMLRWVHPENPYFYQVVRRALDELEVIQVGDLISGRLTDGASYSDDERWRLLLLAWRLSPQRHEADIRSGCGDQGGRLDQMMTEVGSGRDGFHPHVSLPMTLSHRVLAVELAGPRFPPRPVPGGSWSPPTAYDRGNFVQGHIQAIAGMPGTDSGAALNRLLDNPALSAFGDSLKHAISIWRQNYRLVREERLSTEKVARSLAGRAPASSNDLHAFVLDHLRSLSAALKTDGDNLWAEFWNTDPHGRTTDACSENVCSQKLARMLRARLEKAGLLTDIEARHVNGTRCDVMVQAIGARTPIEAKCDWNDDLWIGWHTQLRDRYACEPSAQGFGIYLVYWFGEERGGSRRVAPGHKPTTACECEEILRTLMAGEMPKLVPVVLDLTPMVSRSAEREAARNNGQAPSA